MKRNNQNQEPDLSKMSQLLLSGATMLGESCPDCKVPLFKKNDNIFCPQCGRKAVYARNEDEITQIEQKQSLDKSITQLKDVLAGKINFLTNQLASTEDPQQIVTALELIEKILLVLQKLS
jgi:UPF0148 protein